MNLNGDLSPEYRAHRFRHDAGLPTPLAYAILKEEALKQLPALRIRETSWTRNVGGCCVKAMCPICVNRQFPPRMLFSLAHELGHYLIPAHVAKGKAFICALEMALSFDRQEEREANRFAAELLMPIGRFRERIRTTLLTADGISELAKYFGTSMSATAFRLTDALDDRVVVVLCRKGTVEWSAKSQVARRLVLHRHPSGALRVAQQTPPVRGPASHWFAGVDETDMVNQVVIPILGDTQLVVVNYPFSDQNEDEYWEHLDDPYGDRQAQVRTRSRR